MKKIFIFILPVLLLGCEKDPVAPTLVDNKENVFSVSESTSVFFVSGNLEYGTRYSSNKGWTLGDLVSVNGESRETIVGVIDLFQYGASGYNNVRPGVQNNENILPKGDICGTDYDWGQYCDIRDVEESRHLRVLTADEWEYLYYKRPNAQQLREIFNYSEITYLLLFPDNWIGSYNQKVYNSLNLDEMYPLNAVETLQLLGIALIPYITARNSTYYNYPTAKSGMYWTSTYGAAFSVYGGVVYNVEPNCFLAVQLVKDAKK